MRFWLHRALAVASLLASCPALADQPPAAAPPAKPAATARPALTDPRPPQPETPARTHLAPGPKPEPVPWQRHIEIGGSFALVTRPTSEDISGNPSAIDYEPTPGFGLHARWNIVRWLQFSAYFVDANHSLNLPAGSLGLGDAQIEAGSVSTFVFGARVAPQLWLGERARAWVGAGIGWGRLEFGRMNVTESGREPFVIRERSSPFLEFPFCLGGSFEIIQRWLSVDVEVTAAFVDDQDGNALEDFQAIDSFGKKRNIEGFPGVDAAFVQTIGLSLLL